MDDSTRKTIATLGGLSAIAGAAAGTGAFSRTEATRGVNVQVAGDADAYLGLEPAPDSPNSSYASIDDDGHLQIKMSEGNDDTIGDGVNPNAITNFESVFQITNQGTQRINVWIEHDSEYVDFEINGQVIESPEESVSVDVGESEIVDIVVDTREEPVPSDGDMLLEEIVIYADTDAGAEPPAVDATRIVSDDEVSQGDSTTVTITVDLDTVSDVDVFERFDPDLGTASFESASVEGSIVSPSFVDLDTGGGVVLFDGIGTGELIVEYTLRVASDADTGEYQFDPNSIGINTSEQPVEGVDTIEVVT
ncbi:DUF1102 domain-containing protein [Salinarchaeum sp. IM2453]|uniref:DUF1102 domain-containing protein n=1 Tax=Salinarchaeum sp. IM2453 TaxID=2862870 RepID=UPI001C8281B8|nr:DUF1102 domain-containing protein [Salinarchaeum sp. IM2453]QZA88507.1 DUF1102 domain-containing protein [Salinarchaeum sp. IM2453]